MNGGIDTDRAIELRMGCLRLAYAMLGDRTTPDGIIALAAALAAFAISGETPGGKDPRGC